LVYVSSRNVCCHNPNAQWNWLSSDFCAYFHDFFLFLGPEHPFENIAPIIGVVLMTEVFGFSLGFVGYYRKHLIDFKSAIPFILVGVPIGVVGALLLTTLKEFEEALRGAYGLLMLILFFELVGHHKSLHKVHSHNENCDKGDKVNHRMMSVTGQNGVTYTCKKPIQGRGAIATMFGGFLTGLLGVGIGEVVMLQLAKRNGVPIPVAAVTSVFVVIAAASFTQISRLAV
jgi:uncharacterized membrane protein YfcA